MDPLTNNELTHFRRLFDRKHSLPIAYLEFFGEFQMLRSDARRKIILTAFSESGKSGI